MLETEICHGAESKEVYTWSGPVVS